MRLNASSDMFICAAEMKNRLSLSMSVLTAPPVEPVLVFDAVPVAIVPDVLTVSVVVSACRLGQASANRARRAIGASDLTSVCC